MEQDVAVIIAKCLTGIEYVVKVIIERVRPPRYLPVIQAGVLVQLGFSSQGRGEDGSSGRENDNGGLHFE